MAMCIHIACGDQGFIRLFYQLRYDMLHFAPRTRLPLMSPLLKAVPAFLAVWFLITVPRKLVSVRNAMRDLG